MPAMTEHLTPARSWAPWWEQVAPGEALTVTLSVLGRGEVGLLAGAGGTSTTWTTDKRVLSTGTARLVVTLPATTGGLSRLGLYQRSGNTAVTVTIRTAVLARPTASTTSTTGGTMPLYRLTQQLRGLPAGTIVRCKDNSGPSNPMAGVTYGLPAEGILGVNSVFKLDVRSAPVHGQSAQMIPAWIARDMPSTRYKGVAAFNYNQYNTPVYIVDETVAGIGLGFRDEQGKKYVPPQLYQADRGGHFLGVPFVAGMIPSVGNDGHLAVYRPSTDTWWDAWRARYEATENSWNTRQAGVTQAQVEAGDLVLRNHSPAADGVVPAGSDALGYPGWSAVWGGRIDGYSQSSGRFPTGMGTSATGLATAAGSIGVRELQLALANDTGLDHAISLAIYGPRKSVYSYPASRTDGYIDDELALPEGIRLRLKASYDVDSKTWMHPVAKVIARTAQVKGFIVTDKAGTVNVSCESGLPFKADTGVDPWTDLRRATPTADPTAGYDILRGFPWDQCEVLPLDYGKPA